MEGAYASRTQKMGDTPVPCHPIVSELLCKEYQTSWITCMATKKPAVRIVVS